MDRAARSSVNQTLPNTLDYADLILLSLLAFCLLAARACIQSVTIDEADAFISFATRGGDLVWYPAAQNHVLYTLLERLSWNIFGFHQVAMRLPALLGAAIYLISAVRISILFAGRAFRAAVFVCLALNPFVQDYLVAARGYSLAAAFLLAAIALFCSATAAEPERPAGLRYYAAISTMVGLSFAANFSFAIVDITAAIAFLSVTLISVNRSRQQIVAIALWSLLPGLATALFICADTLLRWPSGEFVFGAHSMRDMVVSFYKDLFPPPNPEIINPSIYRFWGRMGLRLCLLALAASVGQLGVMFSARHVRESISRRPRLRIVAALAITVMLTVAFHWIAFRAFGLYLPKGRTAVFFVPLLTLLLAAGTGIFQRLPSFRYLAVSGIAILMACSVYYLSAFRLHYFQEWRFNEDTKTVFWEIQTVENRCGIHEFSTEWRYASVLNFYRRQYGNPTMKAFTSEFADSTPTNRNAYVLYYPESEDFIRKNSLALWYRNEETGAAVAVRSCPAIPAALP